MQMDTGEEVIYIFLQGKIHNKLINSVVTFGKKLIQSTLGAYLSHFFKPLSQL